MVATMDGHDRLFIKKFQNLTVAAKIKQLGLEGLVVNLRNNQDNSNKFEWPQQCSGTR